MITFDSPYTASFIWTVLLYADGVVLAAASPLRKWGTSG